MNNFAPAKRISSFHPPQRTLMGPGPTEIHPRVLTTMSQPAIGYLDPVFVEMMEELKALLRYAYQTKNPLTFPVSGPGLGGHGILLRQHGGARRQGDRLPQWRVRRPHDRERRALRRRRRWSSRTSGASRSIRKSSRTRSRRIATRKWLRSCTPKPRPACCRMRRRWWKSRTSTTRSTIVDAVTSLGGSPVLVDEWAIDAVYSASQKCLSCTPGLSPVSFSERVVDYVKARKDKIHSWFMDMNLLLGYWGATTRTYHHTAPTNSLFALHEALLLIREEGMENCWARHKRHHIALKAGLEAMGLEFLVDEAASVPQMNAVHLPEGRQRSRSAQEIAQRIRARDRRGPGAAGRQDLALRPDGLLLPSGQRDAVSVGARLGARRHGQPGARGRRGSCGARGVCRDARQGGTGEKESRSESGVTRLSRANKGRTSELPSPFAEEFLGA